SESVTITGKNINAPLLVKNLGTIPFTAAPPAPVAVDSRDDKQPFTDSYSFTISQRLPWSSLLEVAYVGNQSHDLQSGAGYGSNINLVPAGALFGQPNPGTANADNFRHYLGYGDLNLATSNLYANYNAMQIKFLRQKNRYTISGNYTYGKALGIVNASDNTLGGGGATLDPFNLANNYGVQQGDRRHIFNAAYSIQLGNPIHSNKFAAGIINGWQLSGITQWESGANLSYNAGGGNYGMSLVGSGVPCPTAPLGAGVAYPVVCGSNAVIPGSVSATNLTGIPINNQSILGTNAIQLNPLVTCNPNSGLGKNQFINGNCFAVPTTPGQGGPTLIPVSYGPAFFDSDLGIFKNFQIKESMKLQFRVQAYNFLNHPLWSFNGSNLGLSFAQKADGSFSNSSPNFGTVTTKQGNRIVELEVKFYF